MTNFGIQLLILGLKAKQEVNLPFFGIEFLLLAKKGQPIPVAMELTAGPPIMQLKHKKRPILNMKTTRKQEEAAQDCNIPPMKDVFTNIYQYMNICTNARACAHTHPKGEIIPW